MWQLVTKVDTGRAPSFLMVSTVRDLKTFTHFYLAISQAVTNLLMIQHSNEVGQGLLKTNIFGTEGTA